MKALSDKRQTTLASTNPLGVFWFGNNLYIYNSESILISLVPDEYNKETFPAVYDDVKPVPLSDNFETLNSLAVIVPDVVEGLVPELPVNIIVPAVIPTEGKVAVGVALF